MVWHWLLSRPTIEWLSEHKISGAGTDWTADLRILVPRSLVGRGDARWLPLSARLDHFHDLMTKEFVRFKRNQLCILHTRVLKLRPLVNNSRHAWQSAAHPCRSFETSHHNPIPIVVELPYTAPLESTKERDRKSALFENLQSFLARWQTRGRAQGGHYQVVRCRLRLFTGKVPETTTRLSPINTRARSNAYPCATLGVVLLVEAIGRTKEFSV